MKKAFGVLGLVALGAFALGNVCLSHKASVEREQLIAAMRGEQAPEHSQLSQKLDEVGGVIADAVVPEAEAADQYICTLTSTDAGPSNICALGNFSPGTATHSSNQLGQTIDVWCAIPACIKTDVLVSGVLGDGGINCAVDVPAWVYNGTSLANQNATAATGFGGLPRSRFVTGKHNAIWALAADAGNPGCVVSTVIGGQ